MLKRRSIYNLIAVMVTLMLFATGCTNEQQPVVSSGNQQQPVATVAETTPTKEAEPTAKPTPEATPTPTEAPTPTVNPASIPSLDQFEDFNAGKGSIDDVLVVLEYENPEIIVSEINEDFEWKIVAVLSEGESFEEKKEFSYRYVIYTPKKASDISYDSENLKGVWLDGGKYEQTLQLHFRDGVIGSNMELPIKITYDDGTEDSITIYVTR